MPKVSIISVIYDCYSFLPGFISNISQQSMFGDCELILLCPNSSPGNEKTMLTILTRQLKNVRIIQVKHDPGLYELWNLGIELAGGEYITNANPDDRRDPSHIAKAVEFLELHPKIDLCASAISCTYDKILSWENSNREADWFQDLAGEFTAADLFVYDEASAGLKSRNLPHCMPVWRKNLHQRFGYFDEANYGPSADWEFWLRVLSHGGRGWLISDILGLYYINPQSYWRGNSKAESYDKKIIKEYGCLYSSSNINQPITTKSYGGRGLNLSNIMGTGFGVHRHGWAEVMQVLEVLHTDSGILLEPFIEKKFHFGTDPGDYHSDNPTPYTYPWVGFLHCTEDTPSWFSKWLKPSSIFSTDMWRISFPYCQGLFVLSSALKKWLVQEAKIQIPISVVMHPSNFEVPQFQWEIFKTAPQVVQVGHWVRKLNAIYFLQTHWPRILLRKSVDHLPADEIQRFGLELSSRHMDGVKVLDVIDNATYDNMLQSSVVFCNLYTAAANNVVVECIARNTPLLVNRIPATVEYLGEGYPLLFSDMIDASLYIRDIGRIKAAHEYLLSMDKYRFTYKGFIEAVCKSEVYMGLA
jgi:GT2 family glycosyltransferase